MESILTEIKSLEKVHQICIDKKFSFVSYRTPCSAELNTVIQTNGIPLQLNNIGSLNGKKGFVFAPFNISPAFPIQLIRSDIQFSGVKFDESFFDIPENTAADHNGNLNGNELISHNGSAKSKYIRQVKHVKELIDKEEINKLVLSRLYVEPKPENFNASMFLNALHQNYPEAFVYLLYIPGSGMWCGATPETLISVTGDIVKTVSLAGTRRYFDNENPSIWGEKEMLEQNIVTSYIQDVLKKFNVGKYDQEGPVSRKAGNLLHLKSTLSFSFNEIKDSLTAFLEELHPTPSVCGLPKNVAMEFIRNTETHNREYYSGFLGPVNDAENDWKLFVNLRCMKIRPHSLNFFLGAGITSGSDPLREWEETEIKKLTLLNILRSITQ